MVKEIVREMERQVSEACRKYAGKGLLLAVSGGADSVCLLRVLHRVAQWHDIALSVAHCNFHLRGEESDRDTRFVQELCQNLAVQLHIKHFDTETYCADRGLSIEEGCRNLRYGWFDELASELECARIVVAHNADDNAETLLLNLLRGAGIAGLCAMTMDDGRLLRPLLNTTRQQILQYLEAVGQTYVTDSTNLQSDYRRNFLRNRVLPLIEQQWPAAKRSITKTIANLQSQLPLYNIGVEESLWEATDNFIPMHLLQQAPQNRALLHTFLKEKCTVPASMLTEILNVANSDEPSGKRWHTPEAELMMRSDGLYLMQNAECRMQNAEFGIWNLEKEVIENSSEIMVRMRSCRDLRQAWFPADIPEYRFRKAEADDRIQPLGMKGSQTIGKVIKDSHLPPTMWQSVMVMEEVETGKILWVPGLKRSRHHLVSPEDKQILHIYVEDKR